MSLTRKNLYIRLQELKDPRRKQGKRHKLPFTMLIVIMSIMSGASSLYAIEDFAERHKKNLFTLFNLQGKNKRVPTRKTFERLLAAINFKEFSRMFHDWVKDYVSITKGEWLAVDGKLIRGTGSNLNNSLQQFTSLVSIYVQKKRQVLTQDSFNTKEKGEIEVVRELIKMLDLEGVVFTLDALHCQKETVKVIKESKNDYVIGLKKNQKTLYNQAKKKPS